jgi:hypothetical protein
MSAWKEWAVLGDQFESRPEEDDDLQAEAELTTRLIGAATESGAPLSQAEIDEALGVVVRRPPAKD